MGTAGGGGADEPSPCISRGVWGTFHSWAVMGKGQPRKGRPRGRATEGGHCHERQRNNFEDGAAMGSQTRGEGLIVLQ